MKKNTDPRILHKEKLAVALVGQPLKTKPQGR